MAAAPKKKEILAIVLIGISAIALVVSVWSIPPRIDKRLHVELGRSLVSEGLKLLKPGGKFVVITRDTDAFPQPAMKVLFETIERRIHDAGKEIRVVQRIQLDPIRRTLVPSGDFYELLRRAPVGDVIVSLLGPPILEPEEQARLGRPRAGVVAFCPGSSVESLSVLFEAGLLHACIVDQPRADRSQANQFDQLYRIIRANTPG